MKFVLLLIGGLLALMGGWSTIEALYGPRHGDGMGAIGTILTGAGLCAVGVLMFGIGLTMLLGTKVEQPKNVSEKSGEH